jgi:UDP-glucose 4-epimerase
VPRAGTGTDVTATSARRVLITGIAGSLAGLVARRLEARDDIELIVGVDVREPRHGLTRTRFVRADIANPLVAKHLRDDRIDTLVHASLVASPADAGGRLRMKERNVISSMQLFAVCHELDHLERVVLRSSTAVYGSDHRDPAAFREQDVPRVAPEHGYAKDVTDVEGYVRALGQRRDDLDVTVLRFANLVGGSVDSAFHSLLTLPIVPTIAGFDPRLQFVHEDDAVAVIEHVLDGAHPGTFNVAGDGVLYLSQCVRIARQARVPVPQPLVDAVTALVRRSAGADVASDQLRFLRFGRVVDTTRLVEELGHPLRHDSRSAFEDLVRRRRIRGAVDLDGLVRAVSGLGVGPGAEREAPSGSEAVAGAGADRG